MRMPAPLAAPAGPGGASAGGAATAPRLARVLVAGPAGAGAGAATATPGLMMRDETVIPSPGVVGYNWNSYSPTILPLSFETVSFCSRNYYAISTLDVVCTVDCTLRHSTFRLFNRC